MLIYRTTNRGYTSKIYGDGIYARSVKADDIVLLTDYESNITVKIAYYDVDNNFLGLYNFTNLAPGSVYGAYTMTTDAAFLAYLHTIPAAVIANKGALKFSFKFIDANGVEQTTPIFTEQIIDSVYTIDSDVEATIVLDNRYWPIADENQVGLVKIDNDTIKIKEDGTIYAAVDSSKITKLEGDIDCSTANLLNPTISSATLKDTIQASGATIQNGTFQNITLKHNIVAIESEIIQPTISSPEIYKGTLTSGTTLSGDLTGGNVKSDISEATINSQGTAATSPTNKKYVDDAAATTLSEAKKYADSIGGGGTANYVYPSLKELYGNMTVVRSEIGDGNYEYSLDEIATYDGTKINLETLNLGTNFLFENGDSTRWLAKKVWYSSTLYDTNSDEAKAGFYHIVDTDLSGYATKKYVDDADAVLNGSIQVLDSKVDSLNATTTKQLTAMEESINNEIADREAADTAINNTIDNITKALPTDIKADGNSIYLVHDSNKITPQTAVDFKTINGTSILGSGDITIEGGGGGVDVVIDATSSATQGTLTSEQLATLQANNGNRLILHNEIYYLNDKESAPGILVYTHNGYNEGSTSLFKYISITISSRGWVLIEDDISNKLDKVSDNTTYAQAYVKTATGSQQMMNISDTSVPGSVAMRDLQGNIAVNIPVNDEDAAPKGWLEENIKVDNISVSGSTMSINSTSGELANTTFKTVNGTSILGSGDITAGGSTFTLYDETINSTQGVGSGTDTTISGYPWKFGYTCTGTTEKDMAIVSLDTATALSGNIAPVATTAANKVYIYGKERTPNPVIASIIVFKGGN